jgi:hypothetical protein
MLTENEPAKVRPSQGLGGIPGREGGVKVRFRVRGNRQDVDFPPARAITLGLPVET